MVPAVFFIVIYVHFIYKQNHHNLESSKKLRPFSKSTPFKSKKDSSNSNKPVNKAKRWKNEVVAPSLDY